MFYDVYQYQNNTTEGPNWIFVIGHSFEHTHILLSRFHLAIKSIVYPFHLLRRDNFMNVKNFLINHQLLTSSRSIRKKHESQDLSFIDCK